MRDILCSTGVITSSGTSLLISKLSQSFSIIKLRTKEFGRGILACNRTTEYPGTFNLSVSYPRRCVWGRLWCSPLAKLLYHLFPCRMSVDMSAAGADISQVTEPCRLCQTQWLTRPYLGGSADRRWCEFLVIYVAGRWYKSADFC